MSDTTNPAIAKLTAFFQDLTTQAEIKAGDLVQYKSNVPHPDRDLRVGAPGIVTFVFRNPATNGPGGAPIQEISGQNDDIYAQLYALDSDGDFVKCRIPVCLLEAYTGGVEVENPKNNHDFG